MIDQIQPAPRAWDPPANELARALRATETGAHWLPDPEVLADALKAQAAREKAMERVRVRAQGRTYRGTWAR